MNLLILADTYYPENKSAAYMLQSLSEELHQQGSQITVITFSFNIEEDFLSEKINGIEVIRIKIPNPKLNKVKRAFIELSYSRKVIKVLKSYKELKIEGIIYYSPTIFFGQAVKSLKKKFSAPSYLIVRDLFPDWLVKTGQMKKNIIYWFFKYFERKSFLQANFIGMESKEDISYCCQLISGKRIKVEHLYNWYQDPNITDAVGEHESLFKKTKTNLIYGGNIGLAQNILAFLYKLEEIKAYDLRIIIIGDGDQKNEINHFIESSNLDIKLLPMMKRDEYLSLVKLADVGLIVLDKNLRSQNYPGKSFDYMFFSKPIFSYLHSTNEFGLMMNRKNFGYSVKSDHEESLNKKIKMLKNKELMLEKGKNSREALDTYFSVSACADKIIGQFKMHLTNKQ